MSAWKEIAVAVLPNIASQVGEAVREKLKADRERNAPCAHSKLGGRLCAKCSEERS